MSQTVASSHITGPFFYSAKLCLLCLLCVSAVSVFKYFNAIALEAAMPAISLTGNHASLRRQLDRRSA